MGISVGGIRVSVGKAVVGVDMGIRVGEGPVGVVAVSSPQSAVEKREAEPVAEATAEAAADPEADPWLYYSGLWGGYGHYAYRPFAYSYAPYTYSHVYSHGGYPYAYYGKRSADAEPTADAEPAADAKADPWLAYGYGYHPYSYGYAGYLRLLWPLPLHLRICPPRVLWLPLLLWILGQEVNQEKMSCNVQQLF